MKRRTLLTGLAAAAVRPAAVLAPRATLFLAQGFYRLQGTVISTGARVLGSGVYVETTGCAFDSLRWKA